MAGHIKADSLPKPPTKELEFVHITVGMVVGRVTVEADLSASWGIQLGLTDPDFHNLITSAYLLRSDPGYWLLLGVEVSTKGPSCEGFNLYEATPAGEILDPDPYIRTATALDAVYWLNSELQHGRLSPRRTQHEFKRTQVVDLPSTKPDTSRLIRLIHKLTLEVPELQCGGDSLYSTTVRLSNRPDKGPIIRVHITHKYTRECRHNSEAWDCMSVESWSSKDPRTVAAVNKAVAIIADEVAKSSP